MPVKNFCVFIESSDRSAWTGTAKWRAIIVGREGPRGSCGNMALDRQIIIVGYLQLVERQHVQAELDTEIQQWEGKCTGGCRLVASQHCVQLDAELQQWEGKCTGGCR
jgi:hypothetical protein